ncbi:MAG: flagellar brake protein [Clostridia bacterium]|nr:flagellar brake protein [Clostridia bacterium]
MGYSNINELEIGTKLELEICDNNDEKAGLSFVSEFEWAVDEKTAYIAAPIYEGTIYPIRIDSILSVCFINNGDLYVFKARVIDRTVKDNIALLKIQICSEFERIQRRQFYRFECYIPVRYREVKEVANNSEVPFTTSMTRDLSGGGLCIVTEKMMEHDTLLECELELGEANKVYFTGRVVRITEKEVKGKYKYSIGVLFHDIENRDRESIVSYIFKEQRKLRKKGLI